MPFIKKIIDKLIKKNISISVAESCTGGLIANTITKYSGVSKIFSYGIISYSNKAKSKYLSVSKSNLSKFGAVSKEVAEDMINGLFKNEKTKICISTTGIAGPNGGTKLKPVGLVYIGIKINKNNYIFKKIYKGQRLSIQRKTRDFIFRTISVTSSLTPFIDVNSCSTPSIWIAVTAVPLIEDNKIRLNELPNVKP